MIRTVSDLRTRFTECHHHVIIDDDEYEMSADDFVITRQTLTLGITAYEMEFESNIPGEYWHQSSIEDGNLNDWDLEAFIADKRTTPRQATWAREMMTLPMKARKTIDAMTYVIPEELAIVRATLGADDDR